MTLTVRDVLFHDWSLVMTRKHLSEKEIQQYEGMDSSELGAVFFKLGVSKGAHLFEAMLNSYRIAARVANAAWGYVKALENKDSYNSQEEFKSLERSLNDYSPANFSPHRSDLLFAAECFEAFFNEASGKTSAEMEEILFQWTSKLHALAEQKSNGQRWNVQDVLRGFVDQTPYSCITVGDVVHLERSDTLTPFCPTNPRDGVRGVSIPNCAQCRGIAGI